MGVTRAAEARDRRAALSSFSPRSTAFRRRTSLGPARASRAAPATRSTSERPGETIEGIRLIKAAFPESKTVLGISNVSFGLPDGGARSAQLRLSLPLREGRSGSRDRELGEARALRLDSRGGKDSSPRICSSTAARIPWRRSPPTSARRGAAEEGPKVGPDARRAARPLHHRGLKGRPRRGSRGRADRGAPLEIINGPLMKGMDEVGRLFNANELIVAEVLQ